MWTLLFSTTAPNSKLWAQWCGIFCIAAAVIIGAPIYVHSQENDTEADASIASETATENLIEDTSDSAASAPNFITVKGLNRKTFARIVFKIQDAQFFSSNISDSQLLLNFNEPVNGDFSQLPLELPDYVESVEIVAQKDIAITLKQPIARTRKFIGDGFSGIDIIPLSAAEAAASPDSQNKLTHFILPSVKPSQLHPAIQGKPTYNDADFPGAKIISESEYVHTVMTAEQMQKYLNPEIVADATPQEAYPSEIAESEVEEVAPEILKSRTLEVGRERLDKGIRLIFPWEEDVAAAVFARGGYIWAIFNKTAPLSLENIKGIKHIHSLRRMNQKGYTILRIRVGDNYQTSSEYIDEKTLLNVRAQKREQTWMIDLQEDDPSIDGDGMIGTPLPLTIATDDYGPHVSLAATKPQKILEIVDLELGDTLRIIPLATDQEGVAPTRKFVDFTLPQTAQGIVVVAHSDQIRVQEKENEVKITGKDRLNISSEVYTIVAEKQQGISRNKRLKKQVLQTETVFPFYSEEMLRNYGEEGYDFVSVRNRLYKELTESPPDEKTNRRLEIAKFYFFQGLFAESLGVLREIKLRDPVYNNMHEVDLIMAVCHYMQRRYSIAESDFASLAEEMGEDHDNYDEITLWEWASHFRWSKQNRSKSNKDIAVNYIAIYDKFMQKYPKWLRYDMGLMAVEDSLEAGDIETAKTIVEIISYDDIPAKYINDTKFLRARIAVASGDPKEAVSLWTELSEDIDDRFNRARGTFELIKHQLIYNQISTKEAVKKLDRLSIVWRGDNLELDLLKLTGQLHIREGEFLEGLHAWRVLVTNFPNTKEALFIAGRMKRTFIDLFENGDAYDLDPVSALALYFEFRELTPVGERGDRIIQQLAAHFIEADLLDNAITLISHQVRFRAHGDEQNRLALHLAQLYLDNKEPQMVEQALSFINQNADEDVHREKNYLLTYAHIMEENYKAAIDQLKGDDSVTAQDLRLDIFWRQQNWFGLMAIIESRLPEIRENAPFPMKEGQVKDVVRLSVAYATQEYREKLRRLRQEFSERIDDPKALNIFNFVTHDIPKVDYNQFERTVQLEEIENFMNEYAFWPGKDWRNVASVLQHKANEWKSLDALSEEQKDDIVRLALAYAMAADKDALRALGQLNRDFRGVTVNKDTIDVFQILDDRFRAIEDDAFFEGNITLSNIPDFVEQYQAANSLSELNAIVRQP